MLDRILNGDNPYKFDDGTNWGHNIPPLELCQYLPAWDIRIVGEDDHRYDYGDEEHQDDHRFDYQDLNDLDWRESSILTGIDGGDTEEITTIDDKGLYRYPDEDDQYIISHIGSFEYEDLNDPSYSPPEDLIDFDGNEDNENFDNCDFNILSEDNHGEDADPSYMPSEYLVDFEGGDSDQQYNSLYTDTYSYRDDSDSSYVEPSELLDFDGNDNNERNSDFNEISVDNFDQFYDGNNVDLNETAGNVDWDSYYDSEYDLNEYSLIPDYPEYLVRDVDGGDTQEQYKAMKIDIYNYPDEDDQYIISHKGDFGYQDVDDPSYTEPEDLVDFDGGDTDEQYIYFHTDRFSYQDEDDSSYVEPSELLDFDGNDGDDLDLDFNELVKDDYDRFYNDGYDFGILSVDDLKEIYDEDYLNYIVDELVDFDGGDADEQYAILHKNNFSYPDEDEQYIITHVGNFEYPDEDDPVPSSEDLVDFDGNEDVENFEDCDFNILSEDSGDIEPVPSSDPVDVEGGDADDQYQSFYADTYSYQDEDDPSYRPSDDLVDFDGNDNTELDLDFDELIKYDDYDQFYTDDYDFNDLSIDNYDKFYDEDVDLNAILKNREDWDQFYTEDLDFCTFIYDIPEQYANIYSVTVFCIARILEDEIIKQSGDWKALYEVHNMDSPEADAYMNVHIGINPRMNKVYVEFLENRRLKTYMGSDRIRLGTVIANRLNQFFDMTFHNHRYRVEIIMPEDKNTFCCDSTYLASCHTIAYWKSFNGHYCFLEDREEVKLDITKKGFDYDRMEFYRKVHALNVEFQMNEERHYMVPEVFERYRELYEEEFGYKLHDLYEANVKIAVKYDVEYREDMYGRDFSVIDAA